MTKYLILGNDTLLHIIYDYNENNMTASSTISKEDFEKLQGKLEEQWTTDYPEKEVPFEVIFNETSKVNSISLGDLTKRLNNPNHTEG